MCATYGLNRKKKKCDLILRLINCNKTNDTLAAKDRNILPNSPTKIITMIKND